MFEKVSPNLDFVNREVETVHFWKKHDIFEKSIRTARRGEEFSPSSTAPPTANGKPHIGHIETRAIKDLIPR